MKARKGYVYREKSGEWYARFTVRDSAGTRRNLKRRARNKSHGEELLKKLIREFDDGGLERLEAQKITFNDLCDFYEEHYVYYAKYANDRKIAGLRSVLKVTLRYFEKFRTIQAHRHNIRKTTSIQEPAPRHRNSAEHKAKSCNGKPRNGVFETYAEYSRQ